MDEREEMTAEVMYGSKTKQAYELIKQKILMLEYAPGQPLRELELSEQLSMSRTPIRAATSRSMAARAMMFSASAAEMPRLSK